MKLIYLSMYLLSPTAFFLLLLVRFYLMQQTWYKSLTRYRKIYETRKKCLCLGLCADPFLLIRYALGITEMPKWKYPMCVLTRNFDFSNLCTENWAKMRNFFVLKLSWYLCETNIRKTYWLFYLYRFSRYIYSVHIMRLDF